MADENKTQDESKEKIQPETKAEKIQPQASQPAQTSPQAQTTQLSEDQAKELKESISKDVAGQVSETVSKSVIERIGNALGLGKEEKEELPKDSESLQKLVDEKLDAKFNEFREQANKEEEQEKETREQKVNEIVTGWYSQYNQMAKLGKVPAIKNANDPNDEGVQARRKIILTIGKMIEQNKASGEQGYTPTVSDVLISSPDVLSSPPGADLPISGNTQVRETGNDYTYEDVKKGWDEIAAQTNT